MGNRNAFLIGFREIKKRSRANFENIMEEMKTLAYSVNINIVEEFEQTGMSQNPKTYLNSGKIENVKELAKSQGVEYIICAEEMTPLQYKNLVNLFEPLHVIDRTELIFMIFMDHAKSDLGKLKVELAQLYYEITHLTGHGKGLSRLGGGIGTRGLGEQKKTLDKRKILTRIKQIKAKIEKGDKQREVRRKNRLESTLPLVTFVGYTNVGKTSLLNALLKKDACLVEDKFFATLEPACKKLFINDDLTVLINDSVGFISELPQKLFQAFLSTIEEIQFSDLLIIVLPPYEKEAEEHLEVINKTLKDLDVFYKDKIIVYNKCDLVENREYPYVSANSKINLDNLKEKIAEYFI